MALEDDKRTITWDEVYSSWTSFHSYTPEWMERLGTNFFSFKDGELYIHDKNEERTNFYGTTHGCSITYSSNKNPSDVKLYKAIVLETNSDNWYATLNTELESASIGSESNFKFSNKEGMLSSYIRRNSSSNLDFNKLSILGVGELQAIPGSNQYVFSNNIANQVSSNNTDGVGGDKLYFNDGSTKEIGVIDSFNGKTITTVASTNTPTIDDFCFVVKDAESESYGLRGYHAKITLNNKSTSFVELYGANSEVFKSYM